MPLLYRNVPSPFFIFIFYYCFFMTGVGRYDPPLGNDTIYGRTLLECTVHMIYESKMIFYRKAIYRKIPKISPSLYKPLQI